MANHPHPQRARLTSLLLANLTPKEIAHEANVTHACVIKWINNTGFRRMYLNDEERALILSRRKGTASA